jgi:glutathione S-transferase
MLTLHDFGNSVCCQKLRITMRAKGLNWEPIRVDLFKTEQYDPKYLTLNPKGVVPTLVHDGKPVIESTLICEYIDQALDPPAHGAVGFPAGSEAGLRGAKAGWQRFFAKLEQVLTQTE